MSGLLITAVAPGGQGDGAAGAPSAAGGGAESATAAAGGGAGAASATAATGIAAAGIGGGGAVAATRGAGAGGGNGVPVMPGASAMGPDGASAIVGGLASAAARGGPGATGAHAGSDSAIATMMAADRTAPIRRPPHGAFSLSAIAASAISGIAYPPAPFPRKVYAFPALRETTRESGAAQPISINPKIALTSSAAR
jgi:hypothetical protein